MQVNLLLKNIPTLRTIGGKIPPLLIFSDIEVFK